LLIISNSRRVHFPLKLQSTKVYMPLQAIHKYEEDINKYIYKPLKSMKSQYIINTTNNTSCDSYNLSTGLYLIC